MRRKCGIKSMEEKIKVSVIVPMYNVENYIAECIESVLGQSLTQIELICVNDGSIDQTLTICNNYSAQDERLKIIDKKNEGVSAARNAGLEAAVGEYISFIDSDDFLLRDALENLYNCASGEQLDELFFTAVSFFDSEDLKKSQKNYDTYYERKGNYEGVLSGQTMFIEMHKNSEFKPSVCLQLWRRAFIEEHKIRFLEGIIHEDNLFTIQSMALARRTMYLNKAYYMRRLRDGSIMTKEKGIQNAYGYFKVICELIKYSKKEDLSKNKEFWRVYLSRLKILSDMGVRCIKELKEEADTFIDSLGEEEGAMFSLILLNGVEVRERLKKDKDKQLQAVRSKMGAIEEEKKSLEEELNQIRESKSYKIGKWITCIPRKIILWRNKK